MENKAPALIKAWLRREGRKTAWLANWVDVDRATVSVWINGHRMPRRHHRQRLAEITGLDVRGEDAW